MNISRVGRQEFSFISFIAVFCVIASAYLTQRPVVSSGPGHEIYRAAQSIIQGGDFHLPEYEDYHRLFLAKSRERGSLLWQDLYSLDANGRRITKHSHLMALLMIPFVWVGDKVGLVVLAGISAWLLFVLLYEMLVNLLKRDPSMISVVGLLIGTPFLFYAYSPSYDLLIALFALIGLKLAAKMPFGAGVFLAVPVFFRPLAIIPPFFFLLWSDQFHGWKGRVRASGGVLLIIVFFALYNYNCWGTPFTTAHARMPIYTDGEVLFNSAPTSFSIAYFISDWKEKLFSSMGGFLLYNPIVFGLCCLPWAVAGSRFVREINCYIATATFSFVTIYSYEGWASTAYGSRYLLLSHALFSLVALYSIERLAGRYVTSRV